MALGFATKRKAEEVVPPKKPQTAFFLFSNDKRKQLTTQAKFKTSEGKQNTKAITQELGRLWNTIDAKEKQKYVDKAKQLKDKYDSDLAKFKASNPNYKATKKVKKAKKGKKAKKDPNAPKRPASGYQLFCNEKREEINKRSDVKRDGSDKLDVTKVMKILSEMWNGLTDKQKQPYLDQAKKLKEEYDQAKEKYEEKKNDEDEDEDEDDSDDESESD